MTAHTTPTSEAEAEIETDDRSHTPILEARNVEHGFDDEPVLEGLDLTVDEGELVTLMGPNGVGKSVLLSCLAGSTHPDNGTVELFDGRSPTDAQPSTSVMLQGRAIDPDLTGRENCRFYGELHPRATDDWRDIVARLEIEDDLDRPVREYSGGMERKLELAIALSVDAELYLLDEPTAELDLATIQVVHDLLLEYRDDGKTILVTSHAPLDARISDRVAFVQSGRTVATGPPSALLEDLPPVVRIRGAVPTESAFLGERVFQRGDEIRGFVPPESALETLESATKAGDDAVVERDPPSYTDLFNYYTYIRPTRSESTASNQPDAEPETR